MSSPSRHLSIQSALLTAILGLGAFGAAQATTFHVRIDGGDANQCTGRADASYSGSGTAQACAWKHPYYALPSSGSARIAGGDTLIIGSGEYMIGYGAPGTTCSSGDRSACSLGRIPSGPSSTSRTRILGQSASAMPKLWGSERTRSVLNLTGSSNVEVGNLEITDKSACISGHSVASAACNSSSAPFGPWASAGISASDSSNVWLHDLNIHGLAVNGIVAGRLTNWTVERVRINANGWSGWEGDIGTNSSNSGAIVMRDIEIAWNGCNRDPNTGAIVNCWAQKSGGYGDGLGTNTTGGQWLIEDAFIHHNTSDGLDLLYLDGAAGTSVTLRRIYAIGNAGNQVKTRGNMTLENSVIVGSCAYFAGKYYMQAGDLCRASGNAVSMAFGAGHVATIRHNTITGQGDGLLLSVDGTSTSKVLIQNNALLGLPDYLDSVAGKNELAFGHYAYNSSAAVTFAGNLFWNVKSNQCPSGSICGQNPSLTNMTLPSFDALPKAGSPLIDKVAALSAVPSDFLLQPRPSGASSDIGAIEVQAGGSTTPSPSPSPTCTRAAPAVSLTGPTASVAVGTTLTYTLSVGNKDSSECANTSFSLARSIPSGWTGTLSASSINLAPGATATANLDVTSANGSAAGSYSIGAGVGSSVGSIHTASASATYTVKEVDAVELLDALTGSVVTDKTGYRLGERVYVTARVLSKGVPVSGAAVAFQVFRPDGGVSKLAATSDGNGYAKVTYSIGKPRKGEGNYTLDATATKNGLSVTATTTFTVVR